MECLFLSKAGPKSGCLSYLIASIRKETSDVWWIALISVRILINVLFLVRRQININIPLHETNPGIFFELKTLFCQLTFFCSIIRPRPAAEILSRSRNRSRTVWAATAEIRVKDFISDVWKSQPRPQPQSLTSRSRRAGSVCNIKNRKNVEANVRYLRWEVIWGEFDMNCNSLTLKNTSLKSWNRVTEKEVGETNKD